MPIDLLLVSCMLTLAHISLTLFLLALPVVIIVFVFRLFKTPTQPPETIRLKPDIAEIPLNASVTKGPSPMPSLLYHPPTKALGGLNHPAPKQLPTIPQAEMTAKQPYDAFLVLDVEATCFQGTGFEWANEIIEWPVCLLRWKDQRMKGRASSLEVVGEFRSFVKPTWRPQLSQFCTTLTGITQAQVDYAPTFPKVINMFARFLAQHGLIDPKNGIPLQRFCWCSDGPFDVRDFVVKQCFISNIPMPLWLRGDVLDVRRAVCRWTLAHGAYELPPEHLLRSLNITQQLRTLRLDPFQGRLHCGIDDTRNIARIVIELARRGVCLVPNTPINPNRRWRWMGKPGEVLEYCLV